MRTQFHRAQSVPFSMLFIALGVSLAFSAALAQTTDAAPTLQLLSAGYPRTFFFRQAEESAASGHADFAQWSGEFAGLMGIMGKALDEEVPGRSRNADFFTRFKAAHPGQAVLLHMNGNSRDPRFEGGRFFAGHWLYFNGATITADVPAQTGESLIAVSNPELFEAKSGRGGKNANDDIGLCLLDAQGRPDWGRSEQVELLALDKAKKTIRVRLARSEAPQSTAHFWAFAL